MLPTLLIGHSSHKELRWWWSLLGLHDLTSLLQTHWSKKLPLSPKGKYRYFFKKNECSSTRRLVMESKLLSHCTQINFKHRYILNKVWKVKDKDSLIMEFSASPPFNQIRSDDTSNIIRCIPKLCKIIQTNEIWI